MTVKHLHRHLSIFLALFILFHLINHIFALTGPEAHIGLMKKLRVVYRYPPIELVLFLSFAVQAITGFVLIIKKGIFRHSKVGLLQILSGLYLFFFIIFHLYAVLTARYQMKIDTDYHFAAGVVLHYPEKLFFIPYYSLAILSIFTHIGCAHFVKRTKQNPFNIVKYRMEMYAIFIIGILTNVLIISSFISF
jgi:hypothetical protein